MECTRIHRKIGFVAFCGVEDRGSLNEQTANGRAQTKEVLPWTYRIQCKRHLRLVRHDACPSVCPFVNPKRKQMWLFKFDTVLSSGDYLSIPLVSPETEESNLLIPD